LLIFLLTSGGKQTSFELNKKEKVGFYSLEGSKGAGGQLKAILNSKTAGKNINLIKVNSYSDGIDKVKKEKTTAFIFISRESKNFNIYSNKVVSAGRILAESFVSNYNVSNILIDQKYNQYEYIKQNNSDIRNSKFNNLAVKVIKTKGKTPSFKEMISLACMLIFLFYGSLMGSYCIIYDHNKNTDLRHRVAPIRYIENFFGKAVGNVLILSLCTLCIVLITKFVFGMNWNANAAIILSAMLLFLIVVNSFGMLITRITKNIYLCGLIAFSFNFCLVFPIMSYTYTSRSNTIFDILLTVSPHYYTYKAIMDGIYSNSYSNSLHCILILFLIAVFVTAAAYIAVRGIEK
jgi:ABC-2 type transport system permease protein